MELNSFVVSKKGLLGFFLTGTIVFVNILLASSTLYEDNFIYYLWYSYGRPLNWNEDPLVSILFDLFPSGLSYSVWKLFFSSVLLLATWFTWARRMSLWAILAFFTNLVCLDITFNTTRSTIASFIIFYGLSCDKKLFPLLIISGLIHFKFTVIVAFILLVSVMVRRFYVLLVLPVILPILIDTLTSLDLIDLETIRRASAYTINGILPQWYVPVAVIMVFFLIAGIRLIKSSYSVFTVMLLLVVAASIVLGFQYGYRGVPLLLLIVLSVLRDSELILFALLNITLAVYFVVF